MPLHRIVADFAETHHCPSIAWGIVRDGRVVEGAGTHVVYRIASMTKSFSCAAVLGLRDEGALSLDVPVRHYAPELATVLGPAGSPPITLRHLMSMNSGLATDDAWADRHLDITPEEIDRVYAAGPAFAMPTGVGYEYSNLGFGMIGRVVWRVTGTRLQEHVTRRLLRPLGMAATTWVEPRHDDWARPHRVQDGAIITDLHHPIGDGEIAPMGGLWTTVEDLARWVTWLDSAFTHEFAATEWVGLSPASRREMQQWQTHIGTATAAGRTGTAGYGFGLRMFDDADLGVVVGHSGGVPGYGSNMRWVAGRGLGAIALGNVTYAPMAELTMQLLAALHDEGEVPPKAPLDDTVLRGQADRLVAVLNDWPAADAEGRARLDALFADNVDLDESYERRGAQARALVAEEGRLRVVAVRPFVATRGEVQVQGDGDPFTIEVQLAPLLGAPVQSYEVSRPE